MSHPQTDVLAPRRTRGLVVLLLLVLASGAAAGIWWLSTRFQESTDDAYVAGNLVQIMPQIEGSVQAIEADDTDFVQAGQPLVRLDATEARLTYEHALHTLAVEVRELRKLMAEVQQAEAVVAVRRIDIQQQADNLARREVLGRKNAVGMEELQHARDSHAAALHNLLEAQARARSISELLRHTSLAEQPRVQLAATAVRESWLRLQRTTILSPVSGYVARRAVQAGMRVNPGKPLMAVAPLDALWVDANFKEGQLQSMRVGQPVEVTADVYGKTVRYAGRVVGVTPGTGSAFSLLPPQNATGNWIKIVQRVPVRIALDPAALKEHPLLVGLSAMVRVDTADTSGSMLAQTPAPAAKALRTTVLDVDFAPAEAAIADILQTHADAPEPKPIAPARSAAGPTKAVKSRP